MILLAREFPTGEDRAAIDAAFASHPNPLVGIEAGAEYDRLFSRIVNVAPPPMGVRPPMAETGKERVRA